MKKMQLILDRRQPFFLPYHFLNTWLLKKRIKDIPVPNSIYLLMTYDVENFWGMENDPNQIKNVTFLRKIKKNLAES